MYCRLAGPYPEVTVRFYMLCFVWLACTLPAWCGGCMECRERSSENPIRRADDKTARAASIERRVQAVDTREKTSVDSRFPSIDAAAPEVTEKASFAMR